MDWLRHFDKHTTKGRVRIYRLLIMDGYGSHLTYRVWFYHVKEHKIILFRLPPHSTHLTQPLDLSCVSTIQALSHSQAIDRMGAVMDVELGSYSFWQNFRLPERKRQRRPLV